MITNGQGKAMENRIVGSPPLVSDDKEKYKEQSNSVASNGFRHDVTSASELRHDGSLIPFLQRAERYLLQQQYKESLFAVNQGFGRLLTMPGKNMQNLSCDSANETLLLAPSIRFPGRRRSFRFAVTLLESNNPQDTVAVPHQLAVIGLQSWHELASRDVDEHGTHPLPGQETATPSVSPAAWKHLEPVVRYFDVCRNTDRRSGANGETRPAKYNPVQFSFCQTLSMEVLPVWIPFWESHGYEREVFLWATQILLAVSGGLQRKATTLEKRMTRNQEALWMHYICQQLPHAKDVKLAEQILQSISMTNNVPQTETAMKLVEQSWDGRRVNLDTLNKISVILGALLSDDGDETKDEPYGVLSGCLVSFEALSKAHASILKLRQQRRKTHRTPTQLAPRSEQTDLTSSDSPSQQQACLPQNYLQQTPTSNEIISTSSLKNAISNGVATFHSYVKKVSQLFNGEASPNGGWLSICTNFNRDGIDVNVNALLHAQRRRRMETIAFTLAFLLLSWRKRRLVGQLGKSVAMALLAPIQELVDALMMPSQRAIGQEKRRA